MLSLSCLLDMGATVLLLSALRLVWYSLSWFSMLPSILQNWQSGLASLCFLFFHLDRLWGSALC